MDAKKYKQKLLEELYAPYHDCQSCPLGSLGRMHIVFGEGNPNARLLFIGEGPGKEEDRQGKPFIGRSGQLLNRIFELVGIERTQIFITNIVKCRPPNNRQPSSMESAICKKLLLIPQMKIIRPTVICTLGSAALTGLLDMPVKITKMRGQPIAFDETTLIPTFHPAYILRNPKSLPLFVDDLEKAVNLLDPQVKFGK